MKHRQSSAFEKRYEPFRDSCGGWTFEIREYQTDLNSITSIDVPSEPDPKEAYRAVVFLEGFIQEKKNTSSWSDNALDEFESFESTIEVESVARALREIAEDNGS